MTYPNNRNAICKYLVGVQMQELIFWPYKVIPVEQRTQFHKQIIAFMEQAFDRGYGPYTNPSRTLFGAENPVNSRTGDIIYRGSRRPWDVHLEIKDQQPSGSIPKMSSSNFAVATQMVIDWLDGKTLEEIVRNATSH